MLAVDCFLVTVKPTTLKVACVKEGDENVTNFFLPSVMNIMMAGGRTQMPTRKSANPRERMNWLVTVRSLGVVSTAIMMRALPSCKGNQ